LPNFVELGTSQQLFFCHPRDFHLSSIHRRWEEKRTDQFSPQPFKPPETGNSLTCFSKAPHSSGDKRAFCLPWKAWLLPFFLAAAECFFFFPRGQGGGLALGGRVVGWSGRPRTGLSGPEFDALFASFDHQGDGRISILGHAAVAMGPKPPGQLIRRNGCGQFWFSSKFVRNSGPYFFFHSECQRRRRVYVLTTGVLVS